MKIGIKQKTEEEEEKKGITFHDYASCLLLF